MPLYEYECTACLKHTEKIQKFSDTEITICPHCGGTLTRVITAPAISFKGGGWYADGYGNAKPAASGEGKGGDSKASDGKGNQGKGDHKGGDSKSDAGTAASSSTEANSSGGSEGSATAPAASAPAAATPATSSSSTSDKK